MRRNISYIITLLLCLNIFAGCGIINEGTTNYTLSEKEQIIQYEPQNTETACESTETDTFPQQEFDIADFDISSVPAYSGSPYIAVNGNKPYFTSSEYSLTSFENYSPLDSLGRCGTAYANIGTDIMPTGERGSIGNIKPTGWQTVKYENVDGKYLYNRCHLIGYQLSGENANELNLITGTRYMNVTGMLPFENMVADYVKETENHVLYRVTPIYEGNNLLASGVLMEAMSMEDKGSDICFNVFCYNVQPGIKINYATGESEPEEGIPQEDNSAPVMTPQAEENFSDTTENYIGNKNTKKFHYPDCNSVFQMKENNKEYLNCTREEAIEKGYEPCNKCRP